MRENSPESPEARSLAPAAHPHRTGWQGLIGPGSKPFEFARRVVWGVYSDGFMHAGNLAYLSLLTLFPFFIVLTAIAQLIGRGGVNIEAMRAVLGPLPPSVASLVEAVAMEVVNARSGSLLWFGAAVGLWTITSFIETIRDIMRRAYGTDYGRPFWQYRLAGIIVVTLAVVLMLFAFSAQITTAAIDELISRFAPGMNPRYFVLVDRFTLAIVMFGAIFIMFWALTPQKYRAWRYPVWPGALFTMLWWQGALYMLPRAIAMFGGYTLTYGSLAGVMVAMLFFWLVGYGLVIGANINAALVNPDKEPLKEHPILDELAEARWIE